MKLLIATCFFLLVATTPGYAQTEEELQQQLEAQKQINELLKQRIRALEQQLLDKAGDAEVIVESTQAATPESAPDKQADDPEQDRALERALVREGLSVLPPGQWELSPGIFWVHDGSNVLRSGRDDYIATLDARVGLPWDSMIGFGIPYIINADREAGDNSGFGDVALRYWKQFRPQSNNKSSLIGSIGYRLPTAEDTTGPVPLGSEFHRISANLSSSRSIDPVVLSGSLFYAHSFSEDINGDDIQPGDSIGLRGSASLAVTPDISGNIGLSVSFIDELEINSVRTDGTDQTAGFLELGAGFLVGKGQFIFLTSDIGITEDAPDFSLGVSLPFRF
jgi:hypothetical protein